MKKVLSIITTVLLVLVILLAVALVGVRLVGISPYTVLSGSMEPTYHVGSLIYVQKVYPDKLEVGDPLTYVIGGGTVVTHRIVELVELDDGSTGFRTKGDANNTVDGTPVRRENVLGKPIFTIPLLGYAAHYIQNPPGSYLAIGACVIIVLLTFLPDLLDKFMGEAPADTEGAVKADSAAAREELKALKDKIAEERARMGMAEEAPPGESDGSPSSELNKAETPPNKSEDTPSETDSI